MREKGSCYKDKDKERTHTMNRTDIHNTEINPALYSQRARAIRNRRIEEFVGGLLLVAIVAATFAFAQVAYGIW